MNLPVSVLKFIFHHCIILRNMIVLSKRECLADDKLMSELNNTDLGFIDYLAVKESETLKKIASLKRYI